MTYLKQHPQVPDFLQMIVYYSVALERSKMQGSDLYYGLSSVGQELLDPFKGILSYSVEFHLMQ
jgi:hypothetical protein